LGVSFSIFEQYGILIYAFSLAAGIMTTQVVQTFRIIARLGGKF
jgi:hypothetical protein